GFDLEGASQMRLHVLDLADGSFEFIWSFHHILMDGWCMSILTNEFYQLLNSAAQGEEANLPEVANYSNYIQWLDTVDKEETKKYWATQLEDYSEVADIQLFNRTEQSAYEELTETLLINEDRFTQLDAICNKIGITHNVFIQGVWGYLLSRYNNTNDVIFGAVVSGRPGELQGVENMIGLFINTIPVRIKYEESETAIELFQRIKANAISSASKHYLSLSKIQEESDLGMDLIDHILVFENYPVQDAIKSDMDNAKTADDQLELYIEDINSFEQTNFDFDILVVPRKKELKIDFKFNNGKYDQEGIKKLTSHFENVIDGFISDIQKPLLEQSYLTLEEKEELIYELNSTHSDLKENGAVADGTENPVNKRSNLNAIETSVLDEFKLQVQRTPEKVALVFEEKQLTYLELDELSSQLCNYFSANNKVAKQDYVGIKINKDEWAIIAIIAVLKAGGAYVPMDVDYPNERIEYIIKDANIQYCLDELELEIIKAEISNYSSASEDIERQPTSLCYLMYTSGSTGEPKGVEIMDQGIVRLVKDANYVNFIAEDKLLSTAAFSFDATTFEFWGMLLNGGELVLAEKDLLLNTASFKKLLHTSQISKIWLTAGWFNQIVDTDVDFFGGLQTLFVGGDKLSPDYINKVKEHYPDLELVNGYGPTENTTFSLTYNIEEKGSTKIPIGKPIKNSTCYILDKNNNLLPKGAVGEICLGGDGVARGYLNKPEITKEKFIENTFHEGRLYKTGDVGRWLPDGNVEFIGRVDNQIKIRGHRIEVGDIEIHLGAKPDIREVVVNSYEEEIGKALVAYVVSDLPQKVEELRNFLLKEIPEYMVPQKFIQLETLPLTSNGKVDRKGLPKPDDSNCLFYSNYEAPQDQTEQTLVHIWADILNMKAEKIGVTDNFFMLGGHSLKASNLLSRMQKEFNVKIELKELFEDPTIRTVALHIKLVKMIRKQYEILEDNSETEIEELIF
ncbi:MAG: amino acid adenylation domain-containing protein, partial [Crocinitomix sp.]|nr:amino acid adenylation domain-containing protein [Crocinitomix sp.]